MSHESECPVRVSHTQERPMSVLQECPTRVLRESVPQECRTRVSHKSVSCKSVPQEYPRRVFYKSVLPVCSQLFFSQGAMHAEFGGHPILRALILFNLLDVLDSGSFRSSDSLCGATCSASSHGPRRGRAQPPSQDPRHFADERPPWRASQKESGNDLWLSAAPEVLGELVSRRRGFQVDPQMMGVLGSTEHQKGVLDRGPSFSGHEMLM